MAIVLGSLPGRGATAAPRSPEEFVGHPIGADRRLMQWGTILEYLRHLDAESERLELVELGESTEGRPFVMAIVADEAGLLERERIREQNWRLYDVDATGKDEARSIAESGRGIVAFSLGIHSTEVGASQASVEMLYRLISLDDPVTRRIRERLLILMVPSMNPDGLDLVVEWYGKTVGSEAEGSYPLELYHPFAGHDNNRDGFFNNLIETQHWSRVLYRDWLPQMIVDEHQMGSSGPRLFLPPFDDPVSPSVHPLVYSQLSAAGQQVVSDLTSLGWTGIATSTIFTAEWPGSVRSTGFWHNMLGILSEVASARLATPLHFPEGSLRGAGRGLPEYERRANFLEPWPGGWWRLRDIVDLEIDLTWGFLRWAADRKEDLLFNFYQMNRDAVHHGRELPPYGFVVPFDQHDAGSAYRLVEILHRGGVELHRMDGPFELGERNLNAGAFVIRADQPFRPFVIEMLDSPAYPMLREGGGDGEVIRPYDVTSWRLPDLLGVRVLPIEEPEDLQRWDLEMVDEVQWPVTTIRGAPFVLPCSDNGSYGAVQRLLAARVEVRRLREDVDGGRRGDFVVFQGDAPTLELVRASGAQRATTLDADPGRAASDLRPPRLLIFSPWGGSMDEGWTRLVLERHGFAYERLRPGDLDPSESDAARKLRRRADVILLPSIGRETLESGTQSAGQGRLHDALWPAEYRMGLGAAEVGALLREFVQRGGSLICLDQSVGWAIEHLGLPVRSALADLSRERFYAPGTLLRAEFETQDALAWGMPRTAAVYFARGAGFKPIAWPKQTAVSARYAAEEIQIAGFLVGEEYLAGLPAVVDIPVGEGHVVLFGFSPQRRAQTEATFKLLFNAIVRAGMDP